MQPAAGAGEGVARKSPKINGVVLQRNTGNTLASRTGASLRDLMARMGHDNPRAALIYQHASAEADQTIAKGVNAAVQREQKKTRAARRKRPDDGAAGVLAEVG